MKLGSPYTRNVLGREAEDFGSVSLGHDGAAGEDGPHSPRARLLEGS